MAEIFVFIITYFPNFSWHDQSEFLPNCFIIKTTCVIYSIFKMNE